MKRMTLTISGAVAMMAFAFSTANAQDLVADVQKGCATEIKQYCNGVTLGEGRLAACFYAYEDKLSNKCQYALYEAEAKLQVAAVALNYFVEECGADITKLCADVEAGDGAILNCLTSQASAVSAACTQVITDLTEQDSD